MINRYWVGNPETPFYDLLSILSSALHPEAAPQNYEDLKKATRTEPVPEWVTSFKAQLARVLRGDTEGLHPDAILEAAFYEEDTDAEFLERVWSDLFPDEPLPPRS